MADPLSVAAGVTGFVALGIEICKGLRIYISSYRERGSDTQRIMEKVEYLEASLGVLRGLLLELEPFINRNGSEFRGLLENSITLCQLELSRLKSYAIECGDDLPRPEPSVPFPQTPTTPDGMALNAPLDNPNSTKRRISRAYNKVSYPFKKPTLVELERGVDAFHERVKSSLNLLGL